MAFLAEYLPLILVTAVALSCLVHQRLTAAGQPQRIDMAERGEALLSYPDLPPTIRRDVEICLDTAFGHFWTLVACIITFPIVAPFLLFSKSPLDRLIEERDLLNADQRSNYELVTRLSSRIMFANHPLLTIIFEFEVLLFMPVIVVIGAFSRASLVPNINSQTMRSALEQEPFFPRKLVAA